ncbi:MAG: TerB family tellurite resistance protein [Calothrix sp. C42_A2020_038]|nr:TerB family tellurite resistance protein [Calothrix sp. C42_A2020_038]
MLKSLQAFLRAIAKPESHQDEREATIELMIMTMYVDKSLKVVENEVINQYLSNITWESPLSIDKFLGKATAKVRSTLSDTEKRQAFLEEINTKLSSREVKQQAIKACHDLAIADGELTLQEKEFLDTIARVFQVV